MTKCHTIILVMVIYDTNNNNNDNNSSIQNNIVHSTRCCTMYIPSARYIIVKICLFGVECQVKIIINAQSQGARRRVIKILSRWTCSVVDTYYYCKVGAWTSRIRHANTMEIKAEETRRQEVGIGRTLCDAL